jgi:hypothetical protein
MLQLMSLEKRLTIEKIPAIAIRISVCSKLKLSVAWTKVSL